MSTDAPCPWCGHVGSHPCAVRDYWLGVEDSELGDDGQ